MDTRVPSRGLWWRLVTMIGAALLLVSPIACVAHSDRMHPATSTDVAPDPAMAKVVFIRHSRLGGAIVVTILDQRGRYLGESEADSNFTVKMPPGDYVLASWSESTPAMRASLAAGRVYYVLVDPEMGWGSARIQLIAVSQRSPEFARVEEWLRSTRPIAADEGAGQAYVRSRADDARERLAAAAKHLGEYDAGDLARRTLRPEDGVGASAGQPLPVAPAVAVGVGAPPVAAAIGVAPPASAPVQAAPAAHAGGDDWVLLKNGGRIRGRVMEDEPSGVSVKLLDGTSRKVPRVDVERIDYAR